MTRRRRFLTAIFVLAGVFVLVIYGKGGSALHDSILSPDHTQKVEFHSLARWQRLVRLSSAVDDQYAQLSDVRDDRVLGSSSVFYANGIGPVTWTTDGVDIGVAGRFDRRTGRWTQGEAAD